VIAPCSWLTAFQTFSLGISEILNPVISEVRALIEFWETVIISSALRL